MHTARRHFTDRNRADVPDIKYLIVVAPESFGYLGLYQLTGRAGRNGNQAYVYLLSTDKDDMVAYSSRVQNGYDAAKYDLEKRGASALDDENQSGILHIPYGEMIDKDVIIQAKQIYREVLRKGVDSEKMSQKLNVFLSR